MQKIVLLAETGADIPQELAERYRIHIVPMHVSFGSVSKDDGSFPAEEICRYYESSGELPKTSGSVPEDFIKAFDAIHSQNPEARILYLAYSSATTVSYQSALIASEGRDYVTSVDTKSVSAGQCAVVVTMARLLEEHPEWDMDAAVSAADGLIRRAKMAFIPNDMEYLRAGGRVSNAVALCGKLLGIHPVIEIQDGKLLATRKPRGRLSTLAPQLVKRYALDNDLDREEIWLIRTPRMDETIITSAEEMARSLGFRKVTWIRTGGVITTHGGPGAFGVAGFSKHL